MQDPIADMLTRIRNAQKAGHESVLMPLSKVKHDIAKVLQEEGYIGSIEVEGEIKKNLKLNLKYFDSKPVIVEIKRISRPGLRVYKGCDEISDNRNGLGVFVFSTNAGVVSGNTAKNKGIGGELICSVF